MLLPWILLFSLLTIHANNYKPPQIPKVWIQAKATQVPKNKNPKSNNSPFSFQSENPKLNHAQPNFPERNQILTIQSDSSIKGAHNAKETTDHHRPIRPDNGLAKVYERTSSSTTKMVSLSELFRSFALSTKNKRSLARTKMEATAQGEIRIPNPSF